MAEVITVEDWAEAAYNTLQDLREDDDSTVAQSYLYGVLRAILGQRIRRARRTGSA